MRRHCFIRRCLLSSCLIFGTITPPVWADSDSGSTPEVEQELKEVRQSLESLKETLQKQNELIQKQQAKIEELERRISAPQAVRPEPVEGRTGSPPVSVKGSALPGQIGALLPEIGVVGDIVATSSESSSVAAGNDRVSVRALELVLGSYVDPYSRLDAAVHFSDSEAAEIDEAYMTRWGLPWDLKARFGRFFPRVGKAAAGHRDSLSTVDQPLVIRRYLGSEGYFRTGAELNRIFEGPAGWVLEPSFGVLEGGLAGEGGSLFGSNRRRPTVYSHLKTFKEISDASNVELGLTHLVGSSDADAAFEVNALGVDVTYRHHLTPVNPLKLQGEFFLQQRDEAFSINADTGATTHFDRRPWGGYLLADYRFAPRWSAGARADHVRLVDTAAPRHADQGLSAFLTFYQSEWARWRLQFRHEERANEKTDDSVMFQGTFAIGTHKHQLQ